MASEKSCGARARDTHIFLAGLHLYAMASAATFAFHAHAMSLGSTMAPPHEPSQTHKLGRFCVRVATDVRDARGATRYTFKGYGPNEKIIKIKTIAGRDKRRRAKDSVTEPLITPLAICDVCDDRIEVFNAVQNFHYYIM
jgi:hypothetical protein